MDDYELARAICRIMQDEGYANRRASRPDAKQKNLDDLQIAAQSDLKDLIPNIPEIVSWMNLNRISMKDLTS